MLHRYCCPPPHCCFSGSVSPTGLWTTGGELLFSALWSVGNIVKSDEWKKTHELLKSFVDCLSFGLSGVSSGVWHRMPTHWNVSIHATFPCSLCTPTRGREWVPCPLLSYAGTSPSQLVCETVKCVTCAYICKFHEAKAVTLLPSQAAKWFIKQRLQHLCLFVNKSGPCHAKRFF